MRQLTTEPARFFNPSADGRRAFVGTKSHIDLMDLSDGVPHRYSTDNGAAKLFAFTGTPDGPWAQLWRSPGGPSNLVARASETGGVGSIRFDYFGSLDWPEYLNEWTLEFTFSSSHLLVNRRYFSLYSYPESLVVEFELNGGYFWDRIASSRKTRTAANWQTLAVPGPFGGRVDLRTDPNGSDQLCWTRGFRSISLPPAHSHSCHIMPGSRLVTAHASAGEVLAMTTLNSGVGVHDILCATGVGFDCGAGTSVSAAAFSPDARHLLAGDVSIDRDPFIHLFRYTRNGLEPLQTFDLQLGPLGAINRLGWMPDGLVFYAATNKGVFLLDFDY